MNDPVGTQLLTLIRTADDMKTLRGLRDQFHDQMGSLLSEQPVEQFYNHLNDVHDALIQRTIALSEMQMARLGNGSPPVPYAYILFGSGGRKEQTFSSDQDSGLIYRDPEDEFERDEVKRYFEQFAVTIVQSLQQLGYPPCEGNVISNNLDWNHSLTEWQHKLNGWFEDPNWERVRYLLIVADGRCVYGQEELLSALKRHFYSDMLKNPVIVNHMLSNTMRHKVLIGVFGQLLKEQYGEDAGSLDVKYGAYIPMVNSIRLLAIQAELHETSTLARIQELKARGRLTDEDAQAYTVAFKLFLRLRLMTTEREVDAMYGNNGKLASRRLTKELIDELKTALRVGKKLQRQVHRLMGGKM
ncbi:CBS domain-containing protein [Paenibacillus phyllosphaerae]|uniref:CBS domain-containing protein n=1 Tax=Paenibacillus phyllosphaerae TaxID=274593 RepID=A0A7W5AW94_9BACL|nr:DUF294 nucleotidyltransferase-like domain-containing protein [Paenibacillus phyllosphaerae]MBB3109965.1 CBS domain-containing protein [Paenibacillus phyllosphaerae]